MDYVFNTRQPLHTQQSTQIERTHVFVSRINKDTFLITMSTQGAIHFSSPMFADASSYIDLLMQHKFRRVNVVGREVRQHAKQTKQHPHTFAPCEHGDI